MNGFNRNIGILASGSGTTAEYVIRATQTGVLNAEVQMVISDKEEAGVFDRVGRLNDQYGLGIDVAHFGQPKICTNKLIRNQPLYAKPWKSTMLLLYCYWDTYAKFEDHYLNNSARYQSTARHTMHGCLIRTPGHYRKRAGIMAVEFMKKYQSWD
jgi:hypothetical protein